MLEHRFARLPDLREAGDILGRTRLSRNEVPATYIPMKNAVYYALAAGYAEEKGSGLIIGGHNAEDRRLFEDTGEEFFGSLERTLRAGSPRLRKSGLRILRPLRDLTKAEVVALASEMGVPLELTWSCHRAGAEHCWRCEGCRRRMAAFEAARVSDPLLSKKV